LAAAAVVALAVGGSAGWLVARSGTAPPAPPAVFVNPLADARANEYVAIRRQDGAVFGFRVLEADLQTVLLLVENQPPGEPATTRQMRVARTWVGAFLILEGDVSPDICAATVRDFVLDRVTPEVLTPPKLGRPLRCWKFEGRHRVQGQMTTWVSDEIPVHGVVRIDGPRGTLFEYEGSDRSP
jgi:hypothetical protein